ncbi:MAG: hypothetical protein GXY15_11400 [Candidatus Hydrogenedentes bacterium]|nr:hypothetical protein [Candidatus Hydrogenedentota bacterium]
MNRHAARLTRSLLPTALAFAMLLSAPSLAQDTPAASPSALRITGVYPVSELPFTDTIVFYFNKDLAALPENTSPVSLMTVEPEIAPSKAFTSGNALVAQFNSSRLKDIAYLRITPSPTLLAADGTTFSEAPNGFYFALGFDLPRISLDGTPVLEEGRIVYKVLLPVSRQMFLEHFTLELIDAAQSPITSQFADGNGSDRSVLLIFPESTTFPVSMACKAKDSLPSELSAVFANVLSGSIPDPWIKAEAVNWITRREAEFLELSFSRALDLEALKGALTLTVEATGAQVPFQLNAGYGGRYVVFPDISVLEPDSVVRVTVKAPVPGENGNKLVKDFSKTVQRVPSTWDQPEPEAQETKSLNVNWNSWENNGARGPYHQIVFNAPPDLETLKQSLTISPEVADITVTARGRGAVAVSAQFKTGMVYTLTIPEGLKSADGTRTLGNPVTLVTEEMPKFTFAGFDFGGKCYIPNNVFGPLALNALNVSEAEVSVHRVFPSNIARAVNELGDTPTGSYVNETLAELLNTRKIAVPENPDVMQRVPVDIAALLPADRRGVFTLSTQPSDWANTQMVLWTDLGVVGHWKDDEVLVFVHDLHTLAPVAGATVSVWSSKSQQMAALVTDRDGIAHFSALESRLGTPVVAVVETPKDATFLKLEHREQDTPQVSAGLTPFDYDGYDAFLHCDRNLYRPGETVHARWIVRTRFTEAAANVPLLFQLQNPKGRVIQSTPVTLSELGTGGLDIVTEKSHLTGKYTAELRVPGADAPCGTAVFTLEEFVPNRMKATVAVGAPLITPDTPVEIKVTAENLFGGPAAGRNAEGFVLLRPGMFKPDQWPGFSFTNDSVMDPILEKLGQKTTDPEGVAAFSYTYKGRENITMPLEATILGSVYEMGGREVRGSAQALVFPAPVALGVALASVPGDTGTVEVSVAAVKADQQPAELATVSVVLESEDWVYNVRRYVGRNEPWYVKVFRAVQTNEVPLTAGRGTTSFPVSEEWGRFRVRVVSKETPLYASATFLSRWDRLELNAPSSPSLIRLSVNKEVHTPGDACELHIQAPYDGVAFVAVQNDRFRDAKVVPVVNGEALLSFVVTRDHFPNAWLEVTVVRKSDPNPAQAHPFSSFAMAELKVSDASNRIEVALPNLPTEVRPAQHVEFTVETKDAKGVPVSSEVTLAAVDEGIHNILEFANPDPFTFFQRPRLPRFNYAHYYDKVAYDFTPANVGGDAILKRLGGAPQIGDNWIKPVALWSGAVRTDANGLATVGFDLPEFNGQLRLVAVAATPGSTGSTAGSIFVRRPYILQTSMPRFALPGDTFACGASVINTTQEPCQAVIRWRSEGTLSGAGEKTLTLAPGATASDRFEFSASAMGQGRILWEADILPAAGGAPLERLAQDAPIPVRAPAAWQSEVKQYVVNPGETRSFENTQLAGDHTLEHTLKVSANPLHRLQRNLAYLIHYPYGCVEQTTSGAMPLLLLRHHTELFEGVLPGANKVTLEMLNGYVAAGVSRLLGMQTPSGGLGYWSGSSETYVYGSVYAAHFLTLARLENAAEVPEKPFRSLQDYLRKVMNGHFNGGYEFGDLYTRAYALYVLALDGQLDAVEAISRFDRVTMPESGRWLLAAALARNTNDPARVAEYIKTAPAKPYTDTWRSGDLNSEIREVSVKALAAVQAGMPDTEIQPLVNRLVEWIDQNLVYYSTQEAAFVITALNACLSRASTDLTAAAGTITGPDGVGNVQAGGSWQGAAKGPGKTFTVANTGATPLYVAHTCMGLPTLPRTEPVAEGMTLSRTVSTAEGALLAADAPLTHGGSYLVDLAIQVPSDRENVILSDILPAGLEIANPRLDRNALVKMGKIAETKAQDQSENPEEDWNGDAEAEEARREKEEGVQPQYLEARDDRLVVAFEKLKAGTHHFYYVVRAVTPGTFRQPALQGECMYNPEIRAVTLDKTVTIQ